MGQRLGIQLGERGPVLSLRHVHPWEAWTRLENDADGQYGPELAADFVRVMMEYCASLGGTPRLDATAQPELCGIHTVNDQVYRLDVAPYEVRLVAVDCPDHRAGSVVAAVKCFP